MTYPENDEELFEDIETGEVSDLFADALQQTLDEENDLDDELDQRVDEILARQRHKIKRGGLFGV